MNKVLIIGFIAAMCGLAVILSVQNGPVSINEPIIKCNVQTLTLGINEAEIIEQCGKPKKINGTVIFNYNKSEQWVYDYKSWIYVRNGKLDSYQYEKVINDK